MSIFHHKRRRLFAIVETTPGTPIAAASVFVAANGKFPCTTCASSRGPEHGSQPDGLTFDAVDSVRWGESYNVTFTTDARTAARARVWLRLTASCSSPAAWPKRSRLASRSPTPWTPTLARP